MRDASGYEAEAEAEAGAGAGAEAEAEAGAAAEVGLTASLTTGLTWRGVDQARGLPSLHPLSMPHPP